MAPARRTAIVVECEEESDEGSLWKHFSVFRSGLVFGRDTAVQRSFSSTIKEKPLEPCCAPEIASTTIIIQEADPPRAPSATTVAEETAPLSDAEQQQQQPKQELEPTTTDTESILSAKSNAEDSVEDETVHDKIDYKQKDDDSLSDKLEAQADTVIATTTTTTTTEQPLHVPSLPFTLGPYPVPLGGLPHIREETPSVCSDLTKHASICSEQTLKTKPAAAKKLVRFLSGTLMKELESESEDGHDDDDDGDGVGVEDGYASNAPVADSSQDGMSALGMGSFAGQQDQQRRRRVDKQDDVDVDSKDSSFYTRTGAPDSQFRHYNVDVDPTQEDRGADIPLFSAARPHMRGFHMAWMSFFVAL